MEGGIRIESLLTLAAWNRENERNVAPRTPSKVAPLKDLLNHVDRPQLIPLSLIAPQIPRSEHGSDVTPPKSISVLALLDDDVSKPNEVTASTSLRLPTLSNITNPPAKPSKPAFPLAEVLNDEDSRSPNLAAAHPTSSRRSSISSGHTRKRRKLSTAVAEPALPSLAATSNATSAPGLTLPKPQPRVRKEGRRNRIPPVISGLHDPPEDARLVPSITTADGGLRFELPETSRTGSPEPAETALEELAITAPTDIVSHTEQNREVQSRDNTRAVSIEEESLGIDETLQPNEGGTTIEDVTKEYTTRLREEKDSESSKPSQKHRLWDEREHEYLMEGVKRFGMGNWKKILTCPDYHFKSGRTAVDLKDRFRRKHGDTYRNLGEEAARRRKAGQSSGDGNIIPATNDAASKSAAAAESIDGPLTSRTGGQIQRIARRGRMKFTDEEDEALLRGYEKYASQWQKIRTDPELGLEHRSRTDLRDRFRNKFPQQYKSEFNGKKPLDERDANQGSKEAHSTEGSKRSTAPPLESTKDKAEVSKLSSVQASNASTAATVAPVMSTSKPITSNPTNHSILSFPFMLLDTDGFDNLASDDSTSGNINLSRDIVDWADQNITSHSTSGPSGITHLVQPLFPRSQINVSLDQHPMLTAMDGLSLNHLLAYKPGQGVTNSQSSHGLPSTTMPAMPIASMLAEEQQNTSGSAPALTRSGNAVVSLPSVEDLMMGLEGDTRGDLLW